MGMDVRLCISRVAITQEAEYISKLSRIYYKI